MSEPGSVTAWLSRLKAGGDRDEAVVRLWERYFAELVTRAQQHLRGRRAVDDGEDVAMSAIDGFVLGIRQGKFPKLNDRDDLWQILLQMTANKAKNAVRDENRQKRGGGWTSHEIGDRDSDAAGLQLAAPVPDPADVAALADETAKLLSALGPGDIRRVAELALAGHTNVEIATAIGKAVSTVERKLACIREIWSGISTGVGT